MDLGYLGNARLIRQEQRRKPWDLQPREMLLIMMILVQSSCLRNTRSISLRAHGTPDSTLMLDFNAALRVLLCTTIT